MPATVADARDLLIAAVLCPDPVVYIDDRWLYDLTDTLPPIRELNLAAEGPRVVAGGDDITIVAAGYSTRLALNAREMLARDGISAEVVDIRVLNPLSPAVIVDSVRRTGRLVAVDGGWRTCGMAGEILARAVESLPISAWRASPRRITLPDAPAPAAPSLERLYYPQLEHLVETAHEVCRSTCAQDNGRFEGGDPTRISTCTSPIER